ncbi:MAG: pyridoxamine 5'-phosphate oxidase family protein [Pseudomonadota bacterium]
MKIVGTLEELEAIYGEPATASLTKVVHAVTPEYRRLIEASPLVALATSGPEGLDCSPRGDRGQAVIIQDETTLLIPDRRGNNRTDSLRNIVRDPRIALMFLIPGSATTLRINGRASVAIEPSLLEGHAVDGQRPRSVIVIEIGEIYFQCARALIRADIWNPETHVAKGDLPTPGQILKATNDGAFDGEAYDQAWPARAAKTMW